MNKRLSIFLALAVAFCATSSAQTFPETFATIDGRTLTAEDLPTEARDAYLKIGESVRNIRTDLLGRALADMLFEAEAADRGITVDALLDLEVRKKVSTPTEQEIKAFYNERGVAQSGRSLEETKGQIASYLREQAEGSVRDKFVESLKSKFKPALGKDANAPNLAQTDVLATVGAKTLTVASFEDRFKGELYDAVADVYVPITQYIENVAFEKVAALEAKSQNIDTGDFIAREITNKMTQFTSEERRSLEEALRKTLFEKYKVKFFLKPIEPPVFSVATTDDPAKGIATAPLTIVMFSDFQCPACGAAHPMVQRALARYGEKVRLIVRDFPLEAIHENAMNAALAANAAAKQGKFFQYSDILYSNQKALSVDSLKNYAGKIGLNMQRFEVDFNDPKAAEEIRRDRADGAAAGVSGTPTFFLNGVKLQFGTEEDFLTAIEAALAKAVRPAAR